MTEQQQLWANIVANPADDTARLVYADWCDENGDPEHAELSEEIMARWNKLYEWDKWFERGKFLIRKGKDFQCSISSMSQQVRNEASKRGLAAKVSEKGTSLVVEVFVVQHDSPPGSQRG